MTFEHQNKNNSHSNNNNNNIHNYNDNSIDNKETVRRKPIISIDSIKAYK